MIVRGFIELIHPRTVVLGMDARPSSPALKEAAAEVFLASGVDVLDAGFCSTPLYFHSIISAKADGGMMITASHNPARDNGLKICREKAIALSGEKGGFLIRDLIVSGQLKELESAQKGRSEKIDLLDEFVEQTLEKAELEELKPLKVAVDAGNGMAGPEVKALFEKLPAKLTQLYFEPDCSFPNHEANPIKEETLKDLQASVLENGADLGVAYDGDGDRIAFVDEKGKVVRGDFATALIARELLLENPGEEIYYEVRSSKIVPESIKEAGGQPLLGKPGQSIIKEVMRAKNILFAGELSGHYFYRQFGFAENPLFSLALLLKMISREGKPLSELVEPLKKYFQSGEINFEVDDAGKVLAEAEKKFADGEIKKIDGVTIIYPDWWFNLRRSNTEPLVRLNLEADTRELLDEKLKEVKKVIQN